MTIAPQAADIQRFFELVYPAVEEGWLLLSYPDSAHLTPQGKPSWRSAWFDRSQTPWQKIAQAGQRLARTHNVYFGVALQQPTCMPAAWQRSKNATAYIVPGLWLDLDLAYGHHAANTLPASDAEALAFLHALPAVPSCIVHSGGGMYAYWLFREPSVITNAVERQAIAQLVRRFTYTVTTAGNVRGWTLDALDDLARVLRPPGTINFKYGKRVEILHESGARYNPSDFDWLLDMPTPAHTTHAGATITGQPDLVTIAHYYGTGLTQKSKTELAGVHPYHGSSTGDNFNINLDKGLWHCWRHGTGGDALALIAVCEGLIPCEAMRPGVLRSGCFQRVVHLATSQFHANITYAAAPTWLNRARVVPTIFTTMTEQEGNLWH